MNIGQWWQMDIRPLFAYELYAVPSLLIDEHGCLRKGNKLGLVKRLSVLEISPTSADIVIIDVSEQLLLYRIVWSYGGSPSDLIASIQRHVSHYPDGTEKIMVFYKYQDVSAKDHERMRWAGELPSTMSSQS